MAQPPPYNRFKNFANEQALAPAAPLNGAFVDEEFNRVKITTDAVLNNLSQIQDDDGEVARGSIGVEQLKPSLSIGFTLRGPWAAGVNYVVGDGVTTGDSRFWRATASALSSVANEPGEVDAPWELVADFATDLSGALAAQIAAEAAQAAAEAAAIATAADRAQTGIDAAATGADASATAADRIQTGLDAVATGADAIATAADRVQTGLDAAAAAASAAAADVFDPANYIPISGGALLAPVLYVRDEKSAGVAGGTFTAGAWRTRDLNTVKTNTIAGASLGSNQITLPAGTYEVLGGAQAYAVDFHKTRLQDVTNTVTLIVGSPAYHGTSGVASGPSQIMGRFTLSGVTAIELQHQCSSTFATSGLGLASGFSLIEVYSEIRVEKVA